MIQRQHRKISKNQRNTNREQIKKHARDERILEIYGVPQNTHLLSLLHNPIKFHPDWDILLEKIARACENTIFLVQDANDAYTEKLKGRWKIIAPTLLDNSKFLKIMPKDDYMSMISYVDAVLDPLHRGCGTTAYEALVMGVPIVTMPGLQSRSRLVDGLYKIMKLNDAPVALSETEYIEKCIEIVSCKGKKKSLNKLIEENFFRIVESNNVAIQEMKNFLGSDIHPE